MHCLRNEQFQEELWKRSFEFLKDHLSPETVEKYGPLPPPPSTDIPTATTEETSTQAQKEPQDAAGEASKEVTTRETVTAANEAPSEEGAEQQPKQE